MRVKIRPPKIRPPKILPRRYEIIVGIPSYNEAKNISNTTAVIDKGLTKYFPEKKALIINVDSDSQDNTKKAFSNTKTKTPKHYISCPRGKGASLKKLFEYFMETDSAEILVIIDANATTASPRWIRNLTLPILKGFDHVFPIYNGHEHDTTVTNHFCYPVVRGVLGVDIRQLRTGETAMSRRAVDRLLSRAWPASAEKYGIDILSPLSSIFGELRMAQSYLGERLHSEEMDRLIDSFEDRASTLFDKLDKYSNLWKGDVRTRKPPVFFSGHRKSKPPSAKIDYRSRIDYAILEFKKNKAVIGKIVDDTIYKKLSSMFRQGGRLIINADEWAEIVLSFVSASKVSPAKRAKALRPLYFARFVTFYREFLDKPHNVAEQAIIEQGEIFFKSRREFIK